MVIQERRIGRGEVRYELRSCPFCHKDTLEIKYCPNNGLPLWRVICTNCYGMSGWEMGEDEAVALWNGE